ncbi:MAG: polysaccharide deacetylase family protein [Pseudomonadota bacterium]
MQQTSQVCHNHSPIPILTYHQISEPPAQRIPYRDHLYVRPDAFARQMQLLHRLGYRGVSMSQAEPYLRGIKHGRVVAITFDDGYLNALTNALPVLRDLGFTATNYVVSQRVGQVNDWDHPLAATPLMNESELRQWLQPGNDIGGHSRQHLALNDMDESEAYAEIANCKSELETLLDAEVSHFCFPYGSHSDEHVRMAREAGYATAVTTARGRCLPGHHLLRLPRLAVLDSTSLLVFQLKVTTPYDDRPRTLELIRGWMASRKRTSISSRPELER